MIAMHRQRGQGEQQQAKCGGSLGQRSGQTSRWK
jgi:hypothetical protein